MHDPASHATETDPRWQAVLTRDQSQDERFVYSVETTGIYCRPSCAARRPRPAHVRFHNDCAAAEQAGYRPCKRCCPDQPPAAQRHAALIAAACRNIEQAEEPLSLDQLSRDAGLSPSHFHRLFKALTGITPKAYAAARRADRARTALTDPDANVTTALYAAGFNSSGRFYEQAGQMLGMAPQAYRAGGKGAVIHFAIGASSLGAVLVARSERGVCAIQLGDDPDDLLRELQDRFPQAELVGGDAGFERTVAMVVGCVEHPGQSLDLPLDIRGTAFQQRVWQALRDIPPGSTATYSEIAQRIGVPKAVRAVAGACAANALAVVVPCHRVVRTDGSLSGYRWGIARKQALQRREKEQA